MLILVFFGKFAHFYLVGRGEYAKRMERVAGSACLPYVNGNKYNTKTTPG